MLLEWFNIFFDCNCILYSFDHPCTLCHVYTVWQPISMRMKMHILLTVLQAFLMELVRKICLNTKTSNPW